MRYCQNIRGVQRARGACDLGLYRKSPPWGFNEEIQNSKMLQLWVYFEDYFGPIWKNKTVKLSRRMSTV